MRHVFVLAAISTVVAGHAQTLCRIQKHQVFVPQNKPVVLASKPGAPANAQFVLFQTGLRVNTDGAPNSYHPYDPEGQTKAINNIANGIDVQRNGKPVSYSETIRVFEDFRDHDWTVPKGYQINWQNALAVRTSAGREVPCVFTSGEYKGYLASLTALDNDLPDTAAGECGATNQLDERYIPALVIPGANNPMKEFGVGLGDLVIAMNPRNGAVQAAVVGDTGPPGNLGEGSVALNMALLQQTLQPANHAAAKALETGSQEMVIAVIPGSAEYKLQQPYSAANIAARVTDWLASHGYESLQSFSATAQACANTMGTLPNK